MRKFLFILAAAGMFGFLQAQTQEVKKTTTKEGVTKEVKMVEEHATTPKVVKKHALKNHVCNKECKHVYKHGEKGHVCTPECKAKHEANVKGEVKSTKVEVKTTKEVNPKK